MTVSLDPYRTPGVSVFGGTEWGRLVAEAIKDEYGEDVEIAIPHDVIYISTHFRAGFAEVLPDAPFLLPGRDHE